MISATKTYMISGKFKQFEMWSNLSITPILYYNEKHKGYWVFWSGQNIPREAAVALCGSLFSSLYITKSMRDSLYTKYGISARDLTTVCHQLSNTIGQLRDRNIKPPEWLKWFDPRNAADQT